MNIEINGTSYEVPQAVVDKLTGDVLAIGIEKYHTCDIPIFEKVKIGMQGLTRMLLTYFELQVRKQVSKEASLQFRPPPKSDPTLWAVQMFLPTMKKELEHVTLSCQIDVTTNTATAFSVSIPSKGSTGRQMDTARNIGLRQNNRTEIP